MSSIQSALLSGPSRFNAVCLYGNPRPSVSAAHIQQAAAQLLLFFEQKANCPDNLKVLLALNPAVLEGMIPANAAPAAIAEIGDGLFKVGDASVFLQVSAQSDVHRLYALRVIAELFAPLLGSCTEIFGARLLNGQDPFGFQDARPNSETGDYQHAVAAALPAGGSWLFYQRFHQDLQKFFSENSTALQQASVMGVPPMVDKETKQEIDRQLAANAPNESHARLMKQANASLVRRGFSCRHDGEEGLAFIGVAAEFATILTLLQKMQGEHDRLLGFAYPRAGGLFYCPPSADWLVSGAALDFAPITTGPLEQGGHLISYDTTTAFYEYLMLLKANDLFDNRDLPTRIGDAARPRMDDLYRALSSEPARIKEMQDAELAAFKQAETANAQYDQYITYG
jgi:hypothetical protein